MAKVLVTGASGFVGSHLAGALAAQDEEVTCLVRKTSPLERLQPLRVRLVEGDVTDASSLPRAVARSQVVYHVAGRTRALRAEQFYRVNQQGVRNLLDACAREPSPPVVVVVSSLAAAGPSRADRPREETDPLAPVSVYGQSKRAGEQMAEGFADRLPITVVRPPIVLGQADLNGVTLFRMVDCLYLHLVPTWRRHRFSVIHVEDLARLLILAAHKGTRLAPPGKPGGRCAQGYYFAASDVDPTYADLGRMIAAALDHRWVLCVPVSTPTVWGVAAGGEALGQIFRHPLYLNLDKAREATAGSWTCSARRAIDELGFSVGAPLAERLRQTAQWYRDEGWI